MDLKAIVAVFSRSHHLPVIRIFLKKNDGIFGNVKVLWIAFDNKTADHIIPLRL